MKIKINEMFISIQGESSWTGFPFFFVRTSGCNLRCNYCDTKYAYEKGEFFAIEEIIKKIEDSGLNKILITGGEPLIQKNVYILMDKLVKKGYDVLIETNGSILIDKINESVIKIIDFKTPSSGESKKNNFKNVNFLTEKDEVKFVIGNTEDFNWALSIIKKFDLNKKVKNIIFSPIWGKLNANELGKWIINKKLNFVRLQVQLHKIINMP